MLIKVLELLLTYGGVVIAAIVQTLFLLLPINFKNWDDDLLYVMTYIGFQGVTCCLLFIALPWAFEIRMIQYNALIILIFSVIIIAALRAVKLIPLEFTFPIKQPVIAAKRILFTEFYDAKRYVMFLDIPFDLPDGELRYNAIRERLMRTRAEDNLTILEELINNENDTLD
jgi:hypothetical protein